MDAFWGIFIIVGFVSIYKGYRIDERRKMAYRMTMITFIPFLAAWVVTFSVNNFATAFMISIMVSLGITIIFSIGNSEKILEGSGMAMMSGIMGSMIVPMIPLDKKEIINQFVLFLFTSLILLTILNVFFAQMSGTKKRMALFTSISITLIIILFILSLDVQSTIPRHMHM